MKILFKAFFESQFKYCLLTWMFYSRSANNRTNHLQESALREKYDDCDLNFDKLLEKDGSFTIHQYNIQTLCNELYKLYHNLSQTIFSELFARNKSTYNLRFKSDFVILQVSAAFKGFSSISYYGPIHGFRVSVPVCKMHGCY